MFHNPNKPLAGHRVLVVEDEYFVASDIQQAVQSAGGAVEGPYGHIEQAKAALRSEGFDLAVLDINLRGEQSFTIAEALSRKGVHFVFATGYRAGSIPPKWRHVPRCEKPFSDQELVAALVTVARAGEAGSPMSGIGQKP